MSIRLIIKGDKETALVEASLADIRQYNFVKENLQSDGETKYTEALASDADLERVAIWFTKQKHEEVPYPPGTLLWYQFVP